MACQNNRAPSTAGLTPDTPRTPSNNSYQRVSHQAVAASEVRMSNNVLTGDACNEAKIAARTRQESRNPLVWTTISIQTSIPLLRIWSPYHAYREHRDRQHIARLINSKSTITLQQMQKFVFLQSSVTPERKIRLTILHVRYNTCHLYSLPCTKVAYTPISNE